MSTSTPTVLARPLLFPRLLPDVPKPHPTSLPKHGGRMNGRRNLDRELEDLDREEMELEELVCRVSLFH